MKMSFRPLARTLRRPLLCLASLVVAGTVFGQGFVHPGALSTQRDFDRMKTKVNAAAQPWKGSWDKLVANSHASSTYTPAPVVTLIRGTTTAGSENYSRAMNDAAAAYQTAVRWKITGDVAYANKSIQILDAWATTCTGIDGDSNQSLAAGLYGYEFACAAEIMRNYSGWSATNFTRFKNFMLNVFYPKNEDFLVRHHDTCASHYWANWDLCNMCSVMAIGILCDDWAKFNEAVTYFKSGIGAGNINTAVYYMHSSILGQGQEEGRDQGHSGLDYSLLGAFCEMAWNQGLDLYGYGSNRMMAGANYFCQYNLGNSVPYVTYNNCENSNQTVISTNSRGDDRPAWDLIYAHYGVRNGISVPNIGTYAQRLRPEGGGGDYGTTSGGFDQLGFTSLTHYLVAADVSGPIAAGTYRLKNRASGKYLDNAGATTDGADVVQWGTSASNNQKWVVSLSGGFYKLTCVTGNKCLDSLGHTADGSTVGQWGSSASQNQQWRIVDVGGGYYKVINRANGKCLDSGGATTDGAIMESWPSGTSNNQQWQFGP